MLKYVVRLGENGDTFPVSKADAVNQSEFCFVSAKGDADLPPTACAVLGPVADDAGSILHAAGQLAVRQEQLLFLLAEAIDCREQYAPGSSRRVMDHAGRFAEALGLSPDERLTVERGALLRDIGKLRIPNDVLLKNALLSFEDWTLLQQHTTIGADLVRVLGGLRDIEPIVRHHHECFDGVGYPDGLEGETIPLAARIVKVVDVYCAMTSPRLYRDNVFSHEEAVEHLKTETGTHFDPELVGVFLDREIGQAPAKPATSN